VTGYLVAFACIFGVNLLPAFGPPTWAVLVFFKLNSDLAAVPLVLGGAIAAASGRLLLAHGARRLRGRFSRERLESLAAAQEALAGDRRKELGGLVLFALSPVPSAQLFVAAGLLEVRLLALTAAFFAGRVVSYSLYVGGASLARHSLEHTLTAAFSSWWGITLQALMLAGLVALVRVDWTRVIRPRSAPRAPRPKPPPARSPRP
jgi:membrane protein YqaA with SNARE-associated domain